VSQRQRGIHSSGTARGPQRCDGADRQHGRQHRGERERVQHRVSGNRNEPEQLPDDCRERERGRPARRTPCRDDAEAVAHDHPQHGCPRRAERDAHADLERAAADRVVHQLGWITSKWGASANNRRARYYAISRRGRKQLEAEERNWARASSIVERFLGPFEDPA
jgi:hypothetical protein